MKPKITPIEPITQQKWDEMRYAMGDAEKSKTEAPDKTAMEQLMEWADEKYLTNINYQFDALEVAEKAADLLEIEKNQLQKAYQKGLQEGQKQPTKDLPFTY